MTNARQVAPPQRCTLLMGIGQGQYAEKLKEARSWRTVISRASINMKEGERVWKFYIN